jgi:hypothetical protein
MVFNHGSQNNWRSNFDIITILNKIWKTQITHHVFTGSFMRTPGSLILIFLIKSFQNMGPMGLLFWKRLKNQNQQTLTKPNTRPTPDITCWVSPPTKYNTIIFHNKTRRECSPLEACLKHRRQTVFIELDVRIGLALLTRFLIRLCVGWYLLSFPETWT